MGLIAKIGVGAGIAVVALIGLAFVGYYGSQQEGLNKNSIAEDQELAPTNGENPSQLNPQQQVSENDASSTTAEAPVGDAAPVMTSLEGLVPSRNDIGTTWKIGTQDNSTEGLKNGAGVVQTLQQTFSRSEDGFSHVVTVALIKFDTAENATDFYSDRINKVYNEGGFEEYPVNSVNAECYGTFASGSTIDRINFYCAKSNIYYRVQAVATPMFLDDIQSDINQFPKVIASKI